LSLRGMQYYVLNNITKISLPWNLNYMRFNNLEHLAVWPLSMT
jgi:hypothetical protein